MHVRRAYCGGGGGGRVLARPGVPRPPPHPSPPHLDVKAGHLALLALIVKGRAAQRRLLLLQLLLALPVVLQ